MQNHCGVFRSTDSGHQWQDISKPDDRLPYFGFAVAADPKNPEVGWVIPAHSDQNRIALNQSLCICRTEDGGKTWTTFRDGLPQKETYDLVFRHALDLNGDQLAFGTTTGNVYVSENRGESWKCVGNNLPPIYSVRFVN
jgi:photosystem II stability/assembly factor-like uncharacterized protein